MKKYLVLLLLVILILAYFIFFPASGNKTYLSRITLPIVNNQKKLDFSGTKFSVKTDSMEQKYLLRPRFSIKGQFFTLKTSKKIKISPSLSGKFCLSIKISTKSDQKIKFALYKNQILIKNHSLSFVQTINIDKPLELNTSDNLSIEFEGNGTVIVEDLFLYKKEQNKYIFLISADTLRADHLPVYGYHRNTSPNITEFTKDSVLFKNAYSQSPWTLPAHMSLFTSKYEFNHGITKNTELSLEVPFLIEHLSKKFVTKSFNGATYVSPRYGYYRGFDKYVSSSKDSTSQVGAKLLFQSALKEIDKSPKINSFYFLHTYQIHSPFNPPLKNLKRFNPNPKHLKLDPPTIKSTADYQYVKLDQDMISMYNDLYDAEIFTFDQWFGKFISDLKKRGIYQTSMIILLSDHGEEFYEHGGWEHGHTLYNELIKIPIIIKFPAGQFKNQIIENEVGLIDIMPTILEYYSINSQDLALDGFNLLNLIKNKTERGPVFSSLTNGSFVLEIPFKISKIENNKKIIYNLPPAKITENFFKNTPPPYFNFEYYDLEQDSPEKNNLYKNFMRKITQNIKIFKEITEKGKGNFKKQTNQVKLDKDAIARMKALGYL